jgi:50S ribosomal protein L16 3-hydroxylase
VFLLQGEGHRLWRLGQHCDSTTALLPHDELRILDEFETCEEHLLGPGDILYVPPGVAHWGIAQGECTTFSIGFRAPLMSDMLARWTDQLLLQLDEQFYSDAGRAPATRPGELHANDVQQALAQLLRALDENAGYQWFGELVTEPRYDVEVDQELITDAHNLLQEGAESLSLSPAAKLAWLQDETGVVVFANGESLGCSLSALPTLVILCDRQVLEGSKLDSALDDPATLVLLEQLVLNGCLYVE